MTTIPRGFRIRSLVAALALISDVAVLNYALTPERLVEYACYRDGRG